MHPNHTSTYTVLPAMGRMHLLSLLLPVAAASPPGDFLVMAATLIQIKSKMILPIDVGDDEEEVALSSGGAKPSNPWKMKTGCSGLKHSAMEHEGGAVFTAAPL